MAASRPAQAPPVPGVRASGTGPAAWAAGRRPAFDNLRVFLIAAVIVIHGVMSYADLYDAWPYGAVAERQLPDGVVIAVFALFAPVGIFMMALLFLVAGLLTPPSADRKGPGRFARDRLLRLGLPFAAFALVIWPGLLYALYRPFGRTTSGYFAFLVGNFPDNGPLWFVGVLLLVSLGYAALRALRPVQGRSAGPLGTTALLLVAAAIAVASFAIRLAFPYASPTPLDRNEWQWPECVALFAVGASASRQGWPTAVPVPVVRAARRATAATGVALGLFLGVALAVGVAEDDFLGGLHWAAFTVACLEGLLTVFGSIWLLSLAQRRWDTWSRHGRALARSAYAAFVLQGPVLIGLAMALRPLPMSALVKAPVVAVGGLALSFWLGWLLVSRVRAVGRLL